jgi:hypothetical protein
MPSIIRLMTKTDERGSLTVAEKGVPFPVRRVFYTYGVPAGTVRGGHGHVRTRIALVSVAGECSVSGFTLQGEPWSFRLTEPSECLVLDPGDWHEMKFERPGTILLCLASEEYDPADYVRELPIGSKR